MAPPTLARQLGIQCRHSMGMGTSRRRDPPPRVLFTRTGIRPTGHRRLRPHRRPQPAAVARGQDGRHPGRDGRGGVRASRTRRHRERVRARGDVRGQLPRANPGADRLVCLGSQPVGIRLPMGDIGYGLGRGDEGRRATMGGRPSSRGSGRRTSSRTSRATKNGSTDSRCGCEPRVGRATPSRSTRWTETRTSATSCR
jgi:hypothetical protein